MLYLDFNRSWSEFLTPEIKEMLDEIERNLGDNFTPNKASILRFLKTDLSKIRIIILGQDPYFQTNAATGRSFEVGYLNSWNDTFRNVSLKNIVRLIYRSYYPMEFNQGINTYKKIMEKRLAGLFPLKEPHEWFDSLERQGVLFLNSSFSTRINEANSHKALWDEFSKRLIEYLSRLPIQWFVWGNEAKMKTKDIDMGKKFISNHPMLCQITKVEDFLNNQCFLKTKDIVNWLG